MLPFAIARLIVFHVAEVEKIGKNKDNRETTEEEAIQYVKKTVQKLKEEVHAIEIDLPRNYVRQDQIENKLDKIDQRFDKLDAHITKLFERIEQKGL